VLGVAIFLLGAHGHEVSPIGAVGEFGFDVGLAAAQHERLDPGVQLIQVAIAARAAALVQLVEIAVETEKGAKGRGIQKRHD